MNTKKAAADTLQLIDLTPYECWISGVDLSTSRTHVREMLQKIITGEVTGEKAHRWLGWAQGCACAANTAKLETFKEINHNA